MITAVAVIAALLMSNADARIEARDSAPSITELRVTKTHVGHCVVHGAFARCPVQAWQGGRAYCRYLAHIRQRGSRFDVSATRLECWRG